MTAWQSAPASLAAKGAPAPTPTHTTARAPSGTRAVSPATAGEPAYVTWLGRKSSVRLWISAGPGRRLNGQGNRTPGTEPDMDLDEFVSRCEKAWQVFVTGDPGPAQLLFSRRDDVTLANPWGPAVTGWADVSATLEAAAARFRHGHLAAFDVLSRFVSDDLACYHEIERGEAVLGGGTQPESFALRATSMYRREDRQWRIALRHADPIRAPRPVDATLSG
jgi:ketosteroid isomerase-like protein